MIPPTVDVIVLWAHDVLSTPAVGRDLAAIVSAIAAAGEADDLETAGRFHVMTVDPEGGVFWAIPDRCLPMDLWWQVLEAETAFAADPDLPKSGPMLTRAPSAHIRTGRRLRLPVTAVGDDRSVEVRLPLPPHSRDPLAEAGTNSVGPRDLPGVIRWPSPLNTFFQGAAALDAWVERAHIARVIERAERDPDAALAMARERLTRWSQPCQLRRRACWGHARRLNGIKSLLADLEGSESIVVEDVEALRTNDLARTRGQILFEARVYFGVIGYVWGQIERILAAGRLPRRCPACTRFLPADARRNRKYCRQLDCDRERARQRQARSRRSHSSSQDHM